MDELNDEQKEIVTTPYKKVVVVSCASSGKTKCLTERTKFLLNNGVNASDIVLLTFTNSAAEEMRTRIGNNDGLFIGTIHSYANRLLIAKNIDTSRLIEKEDFEGLFKKIFNHPECIKPVKYLLLDEAQDSSESQFNFIMNMVNPDSFFMVGDFNQSLYSWRDSRPDIFIEISKRKDVHVYRLTKNYRNGINILNFAKNIINKSNPIYEDNSIPMKTSFGDVIQIQPVFSEMYRIIKKQGDYKDWFVLTRTNAQLEYVYNYLTKMGIPCVSFKRSKINNDELFEKMKEEKVKVLTIHTSKGLEAKNVMVIGTGLFSEEEVRIAYVAATRAQDLLIWVMSKRNKHRPGKWNGSYDWEKNIDSFI